VVALRRRALTLRSYAKLNLGLEVLGVRQDGNHELRTIFQSIDLHDVIGLRARPRGIRLVCDHPAVPKGEANLAVRAAQELLRWAGLDAGVEIRLEKRIPVAGGLGGGSSNAATVLHGLDQLFGLGLGSVGLDPLARRLGADVPYFLQGGTALGLARGDEIYPLHRQVEAHVVVVDPERPLSTAAVFRRLDATLTPRENGITIFRFVSSDLEGRASYRALVNELERVALEEAPDLAARARDIRRVLVGEGALLAAMSGSGSTYFGLFEERRQATRAGAALRRLGLRASLARTVSLDGYRRSRVIRREGDWRLRGAERG